MNLVIGTLLGVSILCADTYLPQREFEGSWSDYIKLVYNRGKGAVNFLSAIDDFLSLKNIRSVTGYKNPDSTKITIYSYTFRSEDVTLGDIVPLVRAGYKFEFVIDGNLIHKLYLPTNDEFASWTPEQQQTFVSSYDDEQNPDGVVNQADVDKYNEKHRFERKAYGLLISLQKEFPDNVDIVTQPYEIVPEVGRRYVRMQHFKGVVISTLSSAKKWIARKGIFGTANITDSALDKIRIHEDDSFKLTKPKFRSPQHRLSEGSIQFAMIVDHEELLEEILRIPQKWTAAYRKGMHFDSVTPDNHAPQEFVFVDPKTKYRTVVRAYYSEGASTTKRPARDLVEDSKGFLFEPSNTLTRFIETQFVFSHHPDATATRWRLAKQASLADFALYIHGDQALADYSALPTMLMAPRIERDDIVPANRVLSFPPMPEAFNDWADKVFVYDGFVGDDVRFGDLLHPKTTYAEYVDARGVKQYAAIMGTANESSKASLYNADARWSIVSEDPAFGKQMMNYVQGVKNEKRLKPYYREWLKKMLARAANPSAAQLLQDSFYENFKTLCSESATESEKTKALTAIDAKLKKIDVLGKGFSNIVDWFRVNKLSSQMTWTDFYLVFYLLDENQGKHKDFATELARHWSLKVQSEVKRKAAEKDLLKRFKGIEISENKAVVEKGSLGKHVTKALSECAKFLRGIRPRPQVSFTNRIMAGAQ